MSTVPALCADYANSNPDISGVGVRVSFYLQTFLLVLLIDRSWQDAPIALWTFIATSAGLTLAAIVLRAQLTLFQALQVSNLVWLANFGTFFAMASYSRQKAASQRNKNPRHTFDYGVKFGAMAQSLVSMALTMYMWASAKSFGDPRLSPCSYLVKYNFFVIVVPAITVGRIISLVITAILSAVYILITLQELRSYRKNFLDKRKKNLTLPTHSASVRLGLPTFDIPNRPEPLSPSTSFHDVPSVFQLPPATTVRTLEHNRSGHPHRLTLVDHSTSQSQQKAKSNGKRVRRPKRRRWSSDLDPMLVGIIICQVMVFTYFIVSTELLLRRNPSTDLSVAQWSFGQILALIVVIPSALSLIGAIKEHGVKRLSKRKRRDRDETRRRHQENEPSRV